MVSPSSLHLGTSPQRTMLTDGPDLYWATLMHDAHTGTGVVDTPTPA